MSTIDPFKYIDAAHQFTAEDLMHIANRTWNDEDYLVRCIMESMPAKHHDEYLDAVTDPKF